MQLRPVHEKKTNFYTADDDAVIVSSLTATIQQVFRQAQTCMYIHILDVY